MPRKRVMSTYNILAVALMGLWLMGLVFMVVSVNNLLAGD
jgi:hypothetical protein